MATFLMPKMCTSLARSYSTITSTRLVLRNIQTCHKQGTLSTIQKQRGYSDQPSVPHATEKPTPFQQKVLVMSKMYPSVDKVPDRVSRSQLKKAMDIMRVRTSICMIALVLIFAAIMAMIGRRERQSGVGLTKIVLDRRARGE